MEVNSPAVSGVNYTFSEVITIDIQPKFYAFQIDLPEDVTGVWVSLSPQIDCGSVGQVYYDGFVLLEGEYPLDSEPVFSREDGSRGEWGGQAFDNLLRNPSAESAGSVAISTATLSYCMLPPFGKSCGSCFVPFT